MPKLVYKLGQTSVILRVKILDSASTTGGALTALTFSSSGLIISTIADNEATATVYTSAGSTIETVTTLGTFAAPTATKCRFRLVDATNHPGLYEIQIADARWAVSSAKSIIVTVQVTGGVTVDSEIQLSAVDLNDATKIGTTGLSTVTQAQITGGAYSLQTDGSGYIKGSSGTGTGQWKLSSGVIDGNIVLVLGSTPTTQAFPTNFSAMAITSGGIVSADLQTIKTQTITATAGFSFDAQTTEQTGVTTLLTRIGGNITIAGGKVAATMGSTDYSGNTVQTGDAYARIGLAGVGLTNLGDVRIAHLDADVSSRMATFTYTAPDNADIVTSLTDLTALLARTDPSTNIAAIKTQTDKLTFTGGTLVQADVQDWKGSTAPAMTGDAFARLGTAGAGLTALGDTRLANLDTNVASRLATTGYTAPDNADIATALGDLVTLLARTDPTTAIGLIKTVTDKVATMLQGTGPYAYTAAALANAPTGGGGGTVRNITEVTRNISEVD